MVIRLVAQGDALLLELPPALSVDVLSHGAAGGTEFSRKIWPRWWSSLVAARSMLGL